MSTATEERVDHDYTDRTLAAWEQVRPDLDASPTAVINRVLRLAGYLEAGLDEVAASVGLSRKGDFDTLAALRRAGEAGLSPTQLAEAAMITTGGMTSRLDRLERAGLIQRHIDPHDRRALRIHLTGAGQDIVDGLFESSLARQRQFLEPLSSRDRATLSRLLRGLLLHAGDH
jgi:DNA-binding MarR family transcriptional regulator